MKNIKFPFTRAISIFVFIIFLLSGCASHHIEDDEGGISGTGNDLSCELTKNKNHPRCINK